MNAKSLWTMSQALCKIDGVNSNFPLSSRTISLPGCGQIVSEDECMPWINIDFYTPVGNDGQYVDLRAALLAAAAAPPKDRLHYRNPMHNDFLESAEELDENNLMATVARVRMIGLPGKFRGADFQLEDLELLESDGVAEEVHLLLANDLQTLALQRNGAFRSAQVEKLLVDATGVPMMLEPKVREDQIQRLQEFAEISQVGFKLNNPNELPDFSDSLPAVGATIEEAQQIGELASVEMIIRMRTGNANPQDVGVLRRFVRSLTGNDDATKLFAKGRRENQNIEHVNLIRDRIVANGEVEFGEGRRLDGAQCKLLLRQALNTNRQFLLDLVETAE